jgi:hypothetical protein
MAAHLNTPNWPEFTLTAFAPSGHVASAVQSFISTNPSSSAAPVATVLFPLMSTDAYVTGIHHAYLAGATVKPTIPPLEGGGPPGSSSGVARSAPHTRPWGPSRMPSDIACWVSRSLLPSSERATFTRGTPCWLVHRCIHCCTGNPLEFAIDCQSTLVSPLEYSLSSTYRARALKKGSFAPAVQPVYRFTDTDTIPVALHHNIQSLNAVGIHNAPETGAPEKEASTRFLPLLWKLACPSRSFRERRSCHGLVSGFPELSGEVRIM